MIAIGLADGHIYLHNLKFDETVMKFIQDWGPVTTISFRTGKYILYEVDVQNLILIKFLFKTMNFLACIPKILMVI